MNISRLVNIQEQWQHCFTYPSYISIIPFYDARYQTKLEQASYEDEISS